MPEAVCHKCGHRHQVERYGSVNTVKDPLLADRVRDGSAFVWECPECGSANLAVYPFLYHDPALRLMIWLVPPGTKEAGDIELASEQLVETLDGYTLRLVESVGDLIEKISIFSAGLDDVVMEMCKHVTRLELIQANGAKASELASAPIRYYRMDGADNHISFSFPSDGGMHAVEVGFNVYEDCRGILQRNPSIAPGKGFARIDRLWADGLFGT